MNPLLDHLLVGALIAAALLYFIFRKKKCGAGCECGVNRLKRNTRPSK